MSHILGDEGWYLLSLAVVNLEFPRRVVNVNRNREVVGVALVDRGMQPGVQAPPPPVCTNTTTGRGTGIGNI